MRGWGALRRFGVDVREIECPDAARRLLLVDLPADGDAPTVALAAGVHGDEPAAPWALLSLVRDGLLDRHFAYRLWPCTNPSGYAAGTRYNAEGDDVNRSFGGDGTTPEARAIVEANRGRTFALAVDMHEDYEAAGFYCYEPDVGGAPLGRAVIVAVEESGYPIQDLHDAYDLGYPLEAAERVRALERGRVIPNVGAETEAFGSNLPYSMYLLRGTARRTLTIESPRRLDWDSRIAIHRIAVVTALERLRAA